jgi:hypothetical protein
VIFRHTLALVGATWLQGIHNSLRRLHAGFYIWDHENIYMGLVISDDKIDYNVSFYRRVLTFYHTGVVIQIGRVS